MEAELGVQHPRRMKRLLEEVVSRLSEVQEDQFDTDLMLDGYITYMKYKTKEQATVVVADHDVYEAWYKVRGWEALVRLPVLFYK